MKFDYNVNVDAVMAVLCSLVLDVLAVLLLWGVIG